MDGSMVVEHTWDEAAARWLADGVDKAECTKACYASLLRTLAKYWSGRTLASMTTPAIREYAVRRARKVKHRSVNSELQVLRAVIRYAHADDPLVLVPAVRMLKVPPARVKGIAYEQAVQLLRALPAHQLSPVLLALLTGLRKRRVARLEWSDVDLRRRVIHLHPDQAKNRRAWTIPLCKLGVALIARERGKHPTRVFTYRGGPLEQLNTKAFRKARCVAGVPHCQWHHLRHTWASWHLQRGTSLAVLQDLGTWTTPAMVRRYAHLRVEHLRPDAEGLSAGLWGEKGEGVLPLPAAG